MKVQLQEEGKKPELYSARTVPVLWWVDSAGHARTALWSSDDLEYYAYRTFNTLRISGEERELLNSLIAEANRLWSTSSREEALDVLNDALIELGIQAGITFGYMPRGFLDDYRLSISVLPSNEVFWATVDELQKAGGFEAAQERGSRWRWHNAKAFRWKLVPEDMYDRRSLRLITKGNYEYPK